MTTGNMSRERLDSPSQSLQRISRCYPRERLMVRPPFWTSRHLDLLGCHFDDLADGYHGGDSRRPAPELSERRDCQPPGAGKPPARLRDKGKRSRAAERLAKNTWVLVKPKHELVDVLVDYPTSPFQRHSRRVVFRFAGRCVDRFNCRVFSSRWDAGNGAHPSSVPQRFAFLTYSEITTRRRNELRPRAFHPTMHHNMPAGAVFRKKMSKLTPKEWRHDPFLVSVLISIAQAQQRHLVSPSPNPADTPPPSTIELAIYTPIVLLTHWSDQDFIHLYRADISASFLKKLDQPDYDPGIETRVIIVHWKLSYQPYETFGDRLEAELSLFEPVNLSRPQGAERHSGTKCGLTDHGKPAKEACP